MNLFEFLLVILVIVLGLGIAELLGGVARILRGDLPANGLHLLWVAIVFQLQVQLAWGLWGLQSREAWRYPEFLLLLLGPVCLYMSAAVLFPASGTESADLHFMRRRRSFFVLMAGYLVLTALYGQVLYGQGWPLGPSLMRLTVLGVFVTLMLTEKRGVHWALGLFILAGHIWWTYQYTFLVAPILSAR